MTVNRLILIVAALMASSFPALGATYKLEITSTVQSLSESEYFGNDAEPSQVFRRPSSSTRAFGREIAIGDPFQVGIIFTDEPSSSQRLTWAPTHVIHRGAFVSQAVNIGDFLLSKEAEMRPFTDGISVVNDRPNSASGALSDTFLIGADYTLNNWNISTSFQWIDNQGTSFSGNSIPSQVNPIFQKYDRSIFRVYFSQPSELLQTRESIKTLSVVAASDKDSFQVVQIDQPVSSPIPIPTSGVMLASALSLAGIRCFLKRKRASHSI